MNDKLKVTTKLNIKQWSEFVSNHPKGNIFQTPEMCEVYKKTKRYEPMSLAIVDSSENIQAMLLAHVIKEFDGFLGHFSSRSIIQGGPLFVENDVGKEALKLLLQEYDKIVKKNALYTQIRNLYDTSKFKDVFLQNGYKYEEHLNFLVDLTKPKDELWGALTKKRRNRVRMARKKGVTTEEADDKNLISIFYSLIQETYKNARMPLADTSLFESIFDLLILKEMAKIFLAKHENTYIGGICVLTYNTRIYNLYAGASKEYLQLCPNDLLGWYSIEWGLENGYKIFDLGGAGKPNEKYSVREFKKQFGGEEVNFGRYVKIYSPGKLWLAEKGFKVWGRLRL